MCWHTRLSRLNSASDVAGRDHAVAHPDKVSRATTMAGQQVVIVDAYEPSAGLWGYSGGGARSHAAAS